MTAIEAAFGRGEVERPDAAASPASVRERRYLFAGWSLDAARRDLIRTSGLRVDLTSSEFDLLMAFVRAPGEPLSRAALLRTVRGRTWNYYDRSIDTLVARLRKKIDADRSGPPLIRSVRGVGYVLCASVADMRAERAAALALRL